MAVSSGQTVGAQAESAEASVSAGANKGDGYAQVAKDDAYTEAAKSGVSVVAAKSDAYAAAAKSGRTPLALHACCGPCSLEPVKHLREEGFEPVVFWSNANIQPAAEHDLRLNTLLGWTEKEQVAVVLCELGAGSDITSTKTLDQAREQWEACVAPHGFDREARCRACYAIRLAQSCKAAAELGFRFTSTTLAVSPYQLFDTCTEELVAIARSQGLEAIVRDWREFYPEATRESRELGMYRQNYCGCRFSAAEATIERHERRDERKRAKHAGNTASGAH